MIKKSQTLQDLQRVSQAAQEMRAKSGRGLSVSYAGGRRRATWPDNGRPEGKA